MNRRKLFKFAAGSAGVALTSKPSFAATCIEPTKKQTEGPFYPNDWDSYETDADMTKLSEGNSLAKGQLTIIKGRVLDSETCYPIANSQVDVWQANAFGQYHHENDASGDDLKDSDFQYRCRIKTNNKGEFSFKTIKPSPYPASQNWTRPPHIHFKVSALGYEELTTQMYFEGDPLNTQDRILQNMTSSEQKGVTVDFKESEQKVLSGDFEISLKRL